MGGMSSDNILFQGSDLILSEKDSHKLTRRKEDLTKIYTSLTQITHTTVKNGQYVCPVLL
jgi:hypothetical protein